MKRIVSSTLVTGIALAAVMTVGTAESMAAAAAPILSTVNAKVADGGACADGSDLIAVDGSKIYTAFNDAGSIKVVRSLDNAVTWGGVYTVFNGAITSDMVGVAVSGDAVDPNKRIVHVVWENGDGSISYSWADAATLDGQWSAPVQLFAVTDMSFRDPNIVVSKTGKIMIRAENDDLTTEIREARLYFVTATDRESGFSAPTLLPVSTLAVAGDSEMSYDASGNLHHVYPYWSDDTRTKTGIKYTRLNAGATNWSTPISVLAPVAGESNHTSIAANDANNVYISTKMNGGLMTFTTATGGTKWNQRVIFTKTSTVSSAGFTHIVANPSKVLTVGSAFEITGTTPKREGRIYRSTDGGLSWSTATTIPNVDRIYLGIDSAGKSLTLTTGSGWLIGGQDVVYISKEK